MRASDLPFFASPGSRLRACSCGELLCAATPFGHRFASRVTGAASAGSTPQAASPPAIALTHPERVGKLVPMGGGPGGPSLFVPMPTEGIKLPQGVYREPSIENLKKMVAVFVFDASGLTDALYQARLDNMLSRRDHLENFVKSLAANPKQFTDYGPRLGELTAPALVMWGRDDRFVLLDIGLRLVWGLADAELHVFNKCGHWAQWEHADKFNRMALDFLLH